MISVGSRDGRKGLSLRYGGEMDLETELEEGEACFRNDYDDVDDDDSTIDPDVALSYLDEKLQDVLGHFQKDFEGGVSAENLGAKFGGYGSFLPTYQRSPACPHPKTPPKITTNNASISPNDLHIEGRQNSVSTFATRQAPGASSGPSGPAPKARSMIGKMKQEPVNKFGSNGQQPVNDQKSLKVRIRVGSDNLSTRKNAEMSQILSGLGLDGSPTSSLEPSPADSDDFTRHDESPTSILEIMTSFPVLGGVLLSPLPSDLLNLTEKEKREDSSCGSVHKRIQETSLNVKRSTDQNIFSEKKKPNSSDDDFVCVEPTISNNGIDDEELVPNSLRLPHLSDNVLDFRKGAAFKVGSSFIPKEAPPAGPVLAAQDETRVENRKDGNSDSDVSKGGKVVDNGLLVKPCKPKSAQKATSREKVGPATSSGGKKKSKENGFQSGVEVSKSGLKNESFSKNRNNNNGLKMEDSKNNNGKVRKTYLDFFGELDPELEDIDDMALKEKPIGGDKINEKASLESNNSSKERINGNKVPKPSSSSAYPGGNVVPNPNITPNVGPNPNITPNVGPHVAGNVGPTPVSDAGSATVTAAVEDWVCCDKCEKWRLLPPGVNPGILPEKWLCSMLNWLGPGMNKCSISQEETTKAMTSHFPGPNQPGGAQSGAQMMPVDPLQPDQRHHQLIGPQVGVKKKLGIKDEPKQERPSLSSNSTKKNPHISNKTRSLNGANPSSLTNEQEFQDSGHSSNLIAEKHRLKHNDKKKSRESFVNEGNNYANQLMLRNKREASQDYSRDSKKLKMEDNHGTDKDRNFDHDLAVSKEIKTSVNDTPVGISRKDPKDSKPDSKVLGINLKNQNGIFHMVKCEEKDIVKKRKSFEPEDNVEETSESGQRKVKKAKVPTESTREEEKERGRNVKDEQINTIESSRRDVESSRRDVTSLAATSSSSKVSGSHKTKPNNNQETKGSPVESVSSSPLRILNPENNNNNKIILSSRKNQDSKKDWNDDDEDDKGNYRFKKEDVTESLENNKGLGHSKPEITPEFEALDQSGSGPHSNGVKIVGQIHNEEKRSKKNGKGSFSRSKNSKFDTEKVTLKIPNESMDLEEKSKVGPGRNKSQAVVNSDKSEKGPTLKKESKHSIESGKRDAENPSMERDGERLLSSKKEASGRLKLPPSGKVQNEVPRVPPQHGGDAVEGSDASKGGVIKQKKKNENQNVNVNINVKNSSTPNRHKHESPLRRESSNQAAASAIKEAKALKHMADRLKNSGSNHESNSLYFQAALKFLYGSSLLESCNSDVTPSMGMYSSTAKLCEYVAHEYEKSKEMAAAALAYKLAEVAYLKVVYSSHSNASKDRQELQTSLQIGPTGESPSSSASDIDNLNNPAAIDKTTLAKGVNDPQIGGNHLIAARNKPNFLRILNFAQDVNFAMEASRRSQSAFAASNSQPEHKQVIKTALDFNFQDVEGLLQLVRVAMEVISR